MKYRRLFRPIIVRNVEFKNRLVMTAVHTIFSTDGMPNDRFSKFYFERAKGGYGLIIIGGTQIDDHGATGGCMINIQKDESIPYWKTFVDGIHERGAKIAMQLYHAGRYSNHKYLKDGNLPFAPSPIYSKFSRDTPMEMTKQDIDDTIQNFADAAVRVKKAGFDMVEIIGCGGYLISQFLSPLINQRTDEYGGSFENRMRFALEVIRAVREAVGPDYAISYRIAGNDFVSGSNDSDDILKIAEELAKEEIIDLFNITGGWHETTVPQLPGEVPHANYSYHAKGIKKVVNRPVIASNRMNDPAAAEEVLALGQADFIGQCRTAIADPEWPNKVLEDRSKEIRPCVACNQGCLAKVFFGEPLGCLVNGDAGQEYLLEEKSAEKKKNILVVGGGPAGCEFAINAAKNGHSVTLWEKNDRIGGQLHVVCVPPGKEEFKRLATYYETLMQKNGVNVILNKEATVQEIENSIYDEVVMATGSAPKQIDMPVEDNSVEVVLANDVLNGNVIAGKEVIVIGGGSVGCETALTLAKKGSISAEQLYFMLSHKSEPLEKATCLMNTSERHVSIVEIAKKIGAGFDLGTGWPIMKDMKRLGVKSYTQAKVKSVANNTMVIEQVVSEDGKESVETINLPCDTIVLAVGYASANKIVTDLKDMKNLHVLGDADQVGKIIDAICAANELVAKI